MKKIYAMLIALILLGVLTLYAITQYSNSIPSWGVFVSCLYDIFTLLILVIGCFSLAKMKNFMGKKGGGKAQSNSDFHEKTGG